MSKNLDKKIQSSFFLISRPPDQKNSGYVPDYTFTVNNPNYYNRDNLKYNL